MPRVCFFTGKKTSTGYRYTRRGKPKYLGGVGVKVTGRSKRKFKPNLHTVTAVVNGSVKRIKVSTKAMKMGLVVKPVKRKYVYLRQQQQTATGSSAGTAASQSAEQNS